MIRLSQALVSVCAIALALMMLQVTADVIGKYFFNAPIPGSAAIVSSYYMVAVVFLPLAWVEACNGSIVVELIYGLSSKLLQRVMIALGALATMLFYGLLAWVSWGPAMHAYEIGEFTAGTWSVVIWPSRFLLPVGLGLGCVISMLQIVLILKGRDGFDVDEGNHDSVSNEPV